jgi:hypothetical protein
MNVKKFFAPFLSIALAAVFVGCATQGVRNPSGVRVTQMNPDEQGFVAGTGVESQDLVAVTDKMARSVLNTPEILRAQGVPRVVLIPVQNETRFPINKDIFLTRIRTQLNSKSLGAYGCFQRHGIGDLRRSRGACWRRGRRFGCSCFFTKRFVDLGEACFELGLFGEERLAQCDELFELINFHSEFFIA